MRDQEELNRKIRAFYAARPFEKLGKGRKREKVIADQEGKCLGCGIEKWMEEPLVLQLDHIDGNRRNDRRENLRALCPNCHSQTETFGFRGRQHTLESRQHSVNKRFR